MPRKVAEGGRRLYLAYEAGPQGYNLYRLPTGLGHLYGVVAPSLIPRKAGEKVKTDRRGAMMLAHARGPAPGNNTAPDRAAVQHPHPSIFPGRPRTA